MDVVLWVLIGLAAGVIVAALVPEMTISTLSRSGWRRVRSALAGLAGAVVGGYGLVWIDPSQRTDGLTTSLASLAGALWMAGIVEVFASSQRDLEDSPARSNPVEAPSDRRAPTYDAAREALVAGLMEDAVAHEAGRFAEIGRLLPSIREQMTRRETSWSTRLDFAVIFWRGWTTARDHRWRDALEAPMTTADWPRFARIIASDLALDRDTTDPGVVAYFAQPTASTSTENTLAPTTRGTTLFVPPT